MPSLQSLDGKNWGDPSGGETTLVRKCLELRRQDLDTFTVEDTRIMLGQGIGSKYLVPKALQFLSSDSFAEGDLYPGALFTALFSATENQEWLEKRAKEAAAVCRQIISEFEGRGKDPQLTDGRLITGEIRDRMLNTAHEFLKRRR